MCGIVGVIHDSMSTYNNKLVDVFDQLLYIDTFRGPHSTGVAGINIDKGKHSVYKRALAGYDFIQLKQYQKLIKDHNVLIGHNRWATIGAHIDDNAHPFQHGNTIGVHNGTLRNWRSLDGARDFVVDSDWLIWAIDTHGIDYVVERVDGAYAIVWWNLEENTINFVRNSERPMNICLVKEETRYQPDKALVFASEESMLGLCVERNGYKVETSYDIRTHYHYQMEFKVGKKVLFDNLTQRKLKAYVKPPVVTYYNRGNREEPKKKRIVNIISVDSYKGWHDAKTVVQNRDKREMGSISFTLKDPDDKLSLVRTGILYNARRSLFDDIKTGLLSNKIYEGIVQYHNNTSGLYTLSAINEKEEEICDYCNEPIPNDGKDHTDNGTYGQKFICCDDCRKSWGIDDEDIINLPAVKN